jgi:hypothetical protein
MAALPFNHFLSTIAQFLSTVCPTFKDKIPKQGMPWMAEFHRSDFWMRFLEAILDAILERHSYNWILIDNFLPFYFTFLNRRCI